jgi:hypothetical protein
VRRPAVLQETLVFDGTVADNIRYGKADATDEEIVDAATAADAHGFITALPEGYDTRIGQRGRMLSGGQRQRLAIARAMIRDSPVLLLDEPTTGLDAESTQRVLEPMRRLMSGRTTIIISHNLLTVTDADQILFLEDGAITGAGTHQQLLGQHPGYTRLYQLHHPGQPVGPITAGVSPGRAPVGPPANAPTTRVPAARPRWAAADSTSATTRFARILPARPVKTLGRDYPPPATPSRTAGTPPGRDTTATTSRPPAATPGGRNGRARTATGRHRAAAQSAAHSPEPRLGLATLGAHPRPRVSAGETRLEEPILPIAEAVERPGGPPGSGSPPYI